MSEQDVQAVRSFIAGSRDGVPTDLSPLHPDIEWNVQDDLPDAGTWRGHAGVEQFYAGLREVWHPLRFEMEEIEAGDDWVLATVRQTGHGAGSQAPVEQALYPVFRMREGRIARMDVFFARERARAAVGLD